MSPPPSFRFQSKDYSALVVFCIFFGISYGMVGALQFEVLMAIVGTEKFSSAIGLVLLMEAIAVLVGPPGAGQPSGQHRHSPHSTATKHFSKHSMQFTIISMKPFNHYTTKI